MSGEGRGNLDVVADLPVTRFKTFKLAVYLTL